MTGGLCGPNYSPLKISQIICRFFLLRYFINIIIISPGINSEIHHKTTACFLLSQYNIAMLLSRMLLNTRKVKNRRELVRLNFQGKSKELEQAKFEGVKTSEIL